MIAKIIRMAVLPIVMLTTELAAQERDFYVPEKGFIPDQETAIRVAQAILVPIYGEGNITKQEPLEASLIGGVWHVRGTLALLRRFGLDFRNRRPASA